MGGLSYIFPLSLKRGGLSYNYILWKWGVISIFANLKKGGLSGRAYPYTFSMGGPPPPGTKPSQVAPSRVTLNIVDSQWLFQCNQNLYPTALADLVDASIKLVIYFWQSSFLRIIYRICFISSFWEMKFTILSTVVNISDPIIMNRLSLAGSQNLCQTMTWGVL